jgi:hypothetical protein
LPLDRKRLKASQDSIILTPKKLVNKSQAQFWSTEWQAAKREAGDDIASGRARELGKAHDLLNGIRNGLRHALQSRVASRAADQPEAGKRRGNVRRPLSGNLGPFVIKFVMNP